jgi:hypothetical protein
VRSGPGAARTIQLFHTISTRPSKLKQSLGGKRTEAWACCLRAGFQQCKSFVEMCTVRYCPLWHPSHCPMGTVPRVLVQHQCTQTFAG